MSGMFSFFRWDGDPRSGEGRAEKNNSSHSALKICVQVARNNFLFLYCCDKKFLWESFGEDVIVSGVLDFKLNKSPVTLFGDEKKCAATIAQEFPLRRKRK